MAVADAAAAVIETMVEADVVEMAEVEEMGADGRGGRGSWRRCRADGGVELAGD
jgi:hypothetical protein